MFNLPTVRVEQWCNQNKVSSLWGSGGALSTLMLKFVTFDFMYLNRPIYSSKILFYMHRPTRKLITKLKNIAYVVMLWNKWMLWSYFPGLDMFEFRNQHHFFLSEQPFPTSQTNCKIELQRNLFSMVLKRDPKLNINHILEYVSYVLQLQLYFITWH